MDKKQALTELLSGSKEQQKRAATILKNFGQEMQVLNGFSWGGELIQMPHGARLPAFQWGAN